MKKLLIFLMIAIPLVVILVVNLTVNVVTGMVSISVENISLDKDEIRANIDDSISLEAIIVPKNATNKDVIWQSTNEEVARVDLNGNISFVGFGTGYITATTVDGNKRATCYFYVTDTEVHEVKITSNESQNGNYFVGLNETLQLTAIILPTEALNKGVTFTSENEEIASVDSNGLVTGLSEGRVKITATSESKPEINDSIIVEVVKPVEQVMVSTDRAVTSFNTYQISYDIYPLDASVSSVTYVSQDEDIAVVSPSGLVTFLKPGVVVIELITVEGQKTTQIEIAYTKGYAADLILDVQTIEKSINDGGMYIGYSTIPQSVDVDVEFSSDDENVVYVDDSGYVQFMGGGNTLIRARIKSSKDEWIEKVVHVYIESPATDIILEDNYLVATKEFKLTPQAYPLTSTNKDYYFFSNDVSIATVDEEGVVTFLREEYISVPIDIYANKEKNVKKTVVLTYTMGYPTDLTISDETIELDYGEFSQIGYSMYPENVDLNKADVKFKVLSQMGNNGNNVIQLLEDGSIITLGGGEALAEISCVKHNGVRIIKNVRIIVNRKVEEIQFATDLDFVNGEYVTSLQKVEFSIQSATNDATNQNLSWELLNNHAIKSGPNEITFNNAGVAELRIFSEDGATEETINIRYMKSNLLSATLTEVPATIDVGQTIEISVLSVVPTNGSATLSIKINNQVTSNELGKTIEIVDKNKIKAIAGGSATITIQVANLQYVYNVQTIKKAEQILVTPANISTTKDTIVLQSEVLPIDTSNKEVIYEVINQDVAQINENTLIFKKDGIASIKATACDGSGVTYSFTIEKVAKGTGDVALNGEPIYMQVNEINMINLSAVDFEYETKEYVVRTQLPLVDGLNVIEINEDKLIAISLGQAFIDCILTNKYGVEKIIAIEVNVVQVSEDIEFNTALDVISGEYVTASERVALNMNLLPQNTSNKLYSARIVRFTSSVSESVQPYIDELELVFGTVGTAVIEVAADDNGATKQFRIKYTGGDAVDAQLNVKSRESLDIGGVIEVEVTRWIPSDTQNTQIFIREISHSQGVLKVVEINGNKIKAIAGGESRLLVELSNGITKDVVITVLTKIKSLDIDEEIVSSSETIMVNPTISPSNATIKVLSYNLEENEIAYLSGKTIVFTRPGSVNLTIATSDGSNISKQIVVTSTFGYLSHIELGVTEKEINKGGQFTLFVTNLQPSDATHNQIMFKVVSENSNDSSNNHVVQVTGNGLVQGTYGGEAIVRAYALDYYGNEVYRDVKVTVNTSISGFDVNFERELALSHGSLVTARSTLGFDFDIYPSDTTNKLIVCESSDETIAVASANRINFLKNGVVVLKFTANDTTNGTIFKSYSIYYTDGDLISMEIDESAFEDKVLSIEAGNSFTFTPKTYIPADVENINFTIKNKNESRLDNKKPVMMFTDGRIEALNGGEATFTLCANGVDVGRYTIKVYRECESIKVDSDDVFVSTTNHQIIAEAMPSDTYQTKLTYSIFSGNGSVDENGLVTLGGAGIVKVKVASYFNSSIFTIVRIEYTTEVKRISFKQTVTQLYFGGRLDLKVVEEPFNVEPYEVTFTSSDESIATVNSFGRVSVKEKAGEVTIRATVVGREDIYTERTFTVIPIVYSISLELDEVDDKVGIGSYRVWGNKFIKTTDTLIRNTYQMNIRAIEPASASSVKLVWASSDTNIATVDENGLVTFLSTGTVTITVEPEVQHDNSRPVRDSYTFIIVDGFNIFDGAEFDHAFPGETLNSSIVLHTDLTLNHVILLYANIYGNGHMIDFSNVDPSVSGQYDRIKILTNDVLIDNIVLRSWAFDSVAAISTLEGKGKIILVGDLDYKVKNVKIRNSLLENAMICAEAKDAEIEFSGCIIRNSFSAGIVITRSENTTTPPIVRVKDCVFGNSLFSSILFNIEFNATNVNYQSMLYVDNAKFYNWVKLSEFSGKFIEEYVSNPSTQLKNQIKNYTNYIYRYNNEDYIMCGIISKIYVDVKAATVSALEINSYGNVVFEGNNPYTLATIRGTITDLKIKKISLGTMAMGDVTMQMYTLPNTTTYITPASTYDDDPNTYPSIRQPFTN